MGDINTARVCPHCGYPINPGQPSHASCDAKRITQLEAALVALIDALGAQDKKAIESALFVGHGLTF